MTYRPRSRTVAVLFACGVLLALYACGSPYGSDAAPPAPSEAGSDGASNGSDALPPEPQDDDAGQPVGSSDASADAPCPILPTAVLAAPATAATGITCNLDNALAAGGGVAGIDYGDGGITTVGAFHVSSCIEVDFGPGAVLNDATVRMASVAQACTAACSIGCGTYDTAYLFFATETVASTWTFAGQAKITPTLLDYSVPAPAGLQARYVVICRTGGGSARDDVVVDAVSGHCRP